MPVFSLALDVPRKTSLVVDFLSYFRLRPPLPPTPCMAFLNRHGDSSPSSGREDAHTTRRMLVHRSFFPPWSSCPRSIRRPGARMTLGCSCPSSRLPLCFVFPFPPTPPPPALTLVPPPFSDRYPRNHKSCLALPQTAILSAYQVKVG